jgi:hypothetical protein
MKTTAISKLYALRTKIVHFNFCDEIPGGAKRRYEL